MRCGARVTVLSPPRCNNMTVCHMPWIIFWSHSCGACASVVTRTDTIFDQVCGLKACCVSMYTVTVVPLLTTSVDYYPPFLRRLHLSMQDSPAKSRKDPQKSKKTRLPPDSCLNNPVRAQTHAGPEKASALSVIIARYWALKVLVKFGVSQFTKFRVEFCHCFAPCPLCYLLLLLLS